MTSRYDASPSNLRALRDRLAAAAKREGIVFGRLQQHVGVLVVTQFFSALTDDHGDPLLLVKGGVSLELRRGIPASRTSKDLDAVIRGDIATVHDLLAEAGAQGWEGFTAVFTPPVAFEIPALGSDAFRFTAKINYQGKSFVSVPIEVSPIEAGNGDSYDKVSSEALALVGLPNSGAVPCMTLPWQVAQKLHACTETVDEPRANDRAHDLVDLQLLEALLVDEPLDHTRAACVAVFAGRSKHQWPPVLVTLPHWPSIYVRAMEGLDELVLAPDVEQAVLRVQSFVDRIEKSVRE
ncbi:MAG: nucleotidyl transferase AbiEii/AbiGii toxin family protein [Candidatus Nanopelagicales bacterium]|nr:nucleotidyl transferase AbiEii/AbiGii toxin family protein [Candidatus Nanopelagicales bacterium]